MMHASTRYRRLLPGLLVAAACLAAVAAAASDVPEAHRRLDCRRCHQSIGTAESLQDSPRIGALCVDCHTTAPATAAAGLSFHAGRGRRCQSCHAFHDLDVVDTGLGQVSLAALDTATVAHCRSCHAAGADPTALSDGHRAAAVLYHEQAAQLREVSPSAACLRCHSRGAATAWTAGVKGDLILFEEHASHPVGIAVTPGAATALSWIQPEIDPRLPLPGGRVECQTCHAITADTKDRLIPFARPKDLCLGCHRLKPAPAPGPRAVLAAAGH